MEMLFTYAVSVGAGLLIVIAIGLLYEGEMLHAKAILFDDIGGMIGSVNLDNRSLFLNYEVVTFVYSVQFIEDLDLWMKSLIDDSSRGLEKPSKAREACENIMKVFAPLA